MAAVALQGEDIWGLAVRSFFTDNIYGKFDIDLNSLVQNPSEFNPPDISTNEDCPKLISLLSDFMKFFADLLTLQTSVINFTVSSFQRGENAALREVLIEYAPEYQNIADQDLLRAALLWCPAAPQDLITKLRYVVDNALLVDSFLERFTLVDPVSHKVHLRPDVLRSVDWAATDFHLLWHRAEVYESVCEEAALKVPKDKLDPLATPAVTQDWTRHLVGRAAADLRVYRGLAALAGLIDRNRGWAKCGVACARLLLILLEGLAWTTADHSHLLQIFAAADTVVQRLHSVHTDEERLVKTQLVRRLDILRERHTHTSATRTTAMDEETTGLISAHTEDLQSRKLKYAALYEAKHAKTMARLVRKKQSFYDSAAEETKSVIEAIMAAGRSTGELRCPLTNEVIDQSQVYYLTGQLHVSSAVLNQARHRTASQRLEACMQDASERMDVGLYEKLKEMVGKLGNHEYLGHEQTVIATCGHQVSVDPDQPITMEDMLEGGQLSKNQNCPICKYPSNVRIPVFPTDLYQSWISPSGTKNEVLTISRFLTDLFNSNGIQNAFIASTKDLFRSNSTESIATIKKYLPFCEKLDRTISKYCVDHDSIVDRSRKFANKTLTKDNTAQTNLAHLMKLSELKGLGTTIKSFGQSFWSVYQMARTAGILLGSAGETRENKVTKGYLLCETLNKFLQPEELPTAPLNELYCDLAGVLVGFF